MVEAVALGDRPRELIAVDDLVLDAAGASGERPDIRASSITSSTRSRLAKPRSTITSVRNIDELPRPSGGVRPGVPSCSLLLGDLGPRRGRLATRGDGSEMSESVV